MANLFDYVIWRGDLPISEGAPFTEADGLVLSRCAYLPFEEIGLSGVDTLGGICKIMSRFKESDFHLDSDLALCQFICESDRYRNLSITDFVMDTKPEKNKQFAAVTIHLPTEEIYLSYRGTDGTIVGWREDFDMTYKCPVPSQKSAVKYAIRSMEAYPDTGVRIGGHSKGGNLAVYAAAFLPVELQERVVKVCNYDGPGFMEEVVNTDGYRRIKSRVHTYVPQDSIFGRMLFHEEDIEVVKSGVIGFREHDTFSWEVLGANMVRCETGASDVSNMNERALHDLIEQTSPEDREVVLDLIFNFASSADIDSFGELKESFLTNAVPYLKNVVGIKPHQIKTLMNVLNAFIKAYSNAVAETGTSLVNQTANDLYIQAVPPQVQQWIEQQVELRNTQAAAFEVRHEARMEAKEERQEAKAERRAEREAKLELRRADLDTKRDEKLELLIGDIADKRTELEFRKAALEEKVSELEDRIANLDARTKQLTDK